MKPLVDPSAYREQMSPMCRKLDILSDMLDTHSGHLQEGRQEGQNDRNHTELHFFFTQGLNTTNASSSTVHDQVSVLIGFCHSDPRYHPELQVRWQCIVPCEGSLTTTLWLRSVTVPVSVAGAEQLMIRSSSYYLHLQQVGVRSAGPAHSLPASGVLTELGTSDSIKQQPRR